MILDLVAIISIIVISSLVMWKVNDYDFKALFYIPLLIICYFLLTLIFFGFILS